MIQVFFLLARSLALFMKSGFFFLWTSSLIFSHSCPGSFPLNNRTRAIQFFTTSQTPVNPPPLRILFLISLQQPYRIYSLKHWLSVTVIKTRVGNRLERQSLSISLSESERAARVAAPPISINHSIALHLLLRLLSETRRLLFGFEYMWGLRLFDKSV